MESTGGSKWDIRTAGFGIASTAFNLAALLVDGGDFSGEPEKLYQRNQAVDSNADLATTLLPLPVTTTSLSLLSTREFAEAKHYMTQARS